jgi:hypothetical protein
MGQGSLPMRLRLTAVVDFTDRRRDREAGHECIQGDGQNGQHDHPKGASNVLIGWTVVITECMFEHM